MTKVSIAATVAVVLMASCGGSSNGGSSVVGPADVLNANTLAAATTHWLASACGSTAIEIAGDGGVVSSFFNNGFATGTWTTTNGGATMLISYSSPQGFLHIVSVKNFAGSTDSGFFTATVIDSNGQETNCSFNVVVGSL